ncbi:helix-turn-helix transcriptional regulator [Comamonas sp. J-3]|uniref:helix-turn-helix transcriptional regulator n=1 Tax=Comamonas trifloxystrobinivorans TaxID=3350256 RepID=UPI00372865A3
MSSTDISLSPTGSQSFPRKVLRAKDFHPLYGISRSKVYYLLDPDSRYYDPTFPQPFKVGTSERSAVAWWIHEVEAWLASLQRKHHLR